MQWTTVEETSLRLRYPNGGVRAVSELLVRHTAKAIHKHARRLGVCLTHVAFCRKQKRNVKHGWSATPERNCKVVLKSFFPCNTTSSAYILGLLWADGYVLKTRPRVAVEMLTSDIRTIIPVFDTLGHWTVTCRKRRNRKPITSVSTSNSTLHHLLIQLGYSNKDKLGPERVLRRIPSNLQHWWWRGFFDGDGCIYLGTDCTHLTFAGAYRQDWEALSHLLNRLRVSFRVLRFKQKLRSWSVVRISNRNGIRKLGRYLYGNNSDNVGVVRKQIKIRSIMNE